MRTQEKERISRSASFCTTTGERFAYSCYHFGQMLIYGMVAGLLLIYYTDTAKIDPILVSGLMFVGKIWDAVNDTLFGLIMDRVRFKSGNKFKPWLNISTLMLPLSTIFLFAVPTQWSMATRATYAVATYIVWDLIYTMCDAPIFALVTAMTNNIRERATINTYGNIGTTLGSGLVGIILVPIIDRFGYLYPTILLMLAATVFIRPICHKGKERYHLEGEAQADTPTLRETWRYLKANRYLMIIYAYRFISGVFAIATSAHVAKHVMGGLQYLSYSMVAAAPLVLLYWIISPRVLKRFEKIKIIRVSVYIRIILQTLRFFFGRHPVVYILFGGLLNSIGIIPQIAMDTITSDCVEYGTYQSGIRKEGITFSLSTFMNKLVSAFSTSLAGIVLHLIHYDADAVAVTPLVQDQLWLWNYVFPMIGILLSLPLLYAYRLKDHDVQRMADVNAGNLSREEAQKSMERTY